MRFSRQRMLATARRLGLMAIALLIGAASAQAQVADLVSRNALRVCADPANHPMSSEDGSGFENRIASLLPSPGQVQRRMLA